LSQEQLDRFHANMSSPGYELFVNIIGIFNISCIVIRQVEITDSTEFITYWIITQFIINGIFAFEMISYFVILGLKNSYKHLFIVWPESLA
jgi:hypothetical protein